VYLSVRPQANSASGYSARLAYLYTKQQGFNCSLRRSQEFFLEGTVEPRWRIGAEIETSKASRRKGMGMRQLRSLGERRKLPHPGPCRSPGRKLVLVHLSLKEHILIATSLIFLIFLRLIFTHIHSHNNKLLNTRPHGYICPCYTVKTIVKFFSLPFGNPRTLLATPITAQPLLTV